MILIMVFVPASRRISLKTGHASLKRTRNREARTGDETAKGKRGETEKKRREEELKEKVEKRERGDW